jgi:hypothetical protein
MPSSISPSEGIAVERRQEAPPPGLRLTAADRPGVAQPVPERDIPDRPWRPIALIVLVLTLSLTALWEWRMRALELTPGDHGDGPAVWAEQRRRITDDPGQVAIVGDSRILFDTDLDRFQQMTGVRPIQLALPGTNGRPFLEDLADNSKFRGLVIVGVADLSYFRERTGLMAAALEHGKWESPATRAGWQIQKVLRGQLAMLDDAYRFSTLVQRQDRGLRKGVEGPYDDVWKISQSGPDRQTWLWPRIEHDAYLREHARHAWGGFKQPVVSQKIIDMTQAKTRAAVDKIRARGGDVIFVRPPDAAALRVNEEKELPKAKGWDALLTTAKVQGVHIDDLPNVQGLTVPEFSHLSRPCALVFTDAYVRRLTELTPRLKLKADAPTPLATKDCVKAAG